MHCVPLASRAQRLMAIKGIAQKLPHLKTLRRVRAQRLMAIKGIAQKKTRKPVGATSRPKINQEGASNEIVSQNMRDYDSKNN